MSNPPSLAFGNGDALMSAQSLTLELSNLMAVPQAELIRKGLLALVEKEIRLAELEIAIIRERYDVFSKEALYQEIQANRITGHPAWEDYIIWKNKEAHIAQLRQLAEQA
ncbi:MAG: hypothetical protein HY679_02910 [Chloroflexi bacterium]|nr:hypothetical protein [Chloroflexota bacterium]